MLYCYLALLVCVLVTLINKVENANFDLLNIDVFDALAVDTYDIRKLPYRGVQKSEIEKLNEFLIEKTDSPDPDVNLDIVLDEFVSELKNGDPYDSVPVQAKRLVLALRTLYGQNECNKYGFLILRNNLDAIESPIRAILFNQQARRIDKVLAHYIKRHFKNCREQYFTKFDEINRSVDQTLIKHINAFLDNVVQVVTSDNVDRNLGKSYVKRLFDEANRGFLYSYIKPSYIHNVMVDSVKGREEEKYMTRVENEITGSPALNRKVFDRVFHETIAQPCRRYRDIFGPDVFMPLLFDGLYHHEIKEDRVDFYEALLKYVLCKFDHSDLKTLERVADYVKFGWL